MARGRRTNLFLLLGLNCLLLAHTKKPNIIFMLTDDQGSADVKFRNPESPFITDNIDSIAAQAVRLSNYYVHPTCSPTRAALMTGRYAVNVGLSIALIPGNPAGLDTKYPTMSEHLVLEGYETYLVGKWHLGQSMAKHHPRNRGFKHFYGLLGGGFNHYTKQCGNGRFDFWRDFDVEFENTTHSTDLLNEEALRVVTKHAKDPSSDPFFLFLSHPAPHDPLQAPQRYIDMCAHIPTYRRRMSCAMVAGIDEGFGRIIDVLRETGELDNTIIAFSTDNGGVPYAGALNYPFRGSKSTAYEGGVRAPGFIYSPSHLGKNFDFQGLFHVSDFFPTFMAMINATQNIQKSEELDGVNQLPSLVAREKDGVRDSVHIHRDIDRDSHTYRKGPWKIIVGHHFMPFILNRVYNETKSGWLVEGGTWRDKALDLVLQAIDFISPQYNTIFIQYFTWLVFDSFSVGGLRRINTSNTSFTGLMKIKYPTDLEYWRGQEDELYPTVSLFNIENDPQETTNLAKQHPDLVESLLAEAEEKIKRAPNMFRGDMLYKKAPSGPQAGLMSRIRHLGSVHSAVIPFGPFLPEDFDMENADVDDFVFLMREQDPELISMIAKMFITYILLPLLLLRFMYKNIFSK